MATKSKKISVGQWVRFVLGTSEVNGTVVEDRGTIGAGGVRLFRIRIARDSDSEEFIEMPEDEIVPLHS